MKPQCGGEGLDLYILASAQTSIGATWRHRCLTGHSAGVFPVWVAVFTPR